MATTLGGPYAQGAPALKIVQKRFLGLHQWLSPVYSKEIKEQLVSVTLKCVIPIIVVISPRHTHVCSSAYINVLCALNEPSER